MYPAYVVAIAREAIRTVGHFAVLDTAVVTIAISLSNANTWKPPRPHFETAAAATTRTSVLTIAAGTIILLSKYQLLSSLLELMTAIERLPDFIVGCIGICC